MNSELFPPIPPTADPAAALSVARRLYLDAVMRHEDADSDDTGDLVAELNAARLALNLAEAEALERWFEQNHNTKPA